MSNRDKGLFNKYFVWKNNGPDKDATPVEDWVFVLNPSTDPGAVVALRAYAQWCLDNEYYALSDDIEAMLDT